jgi:hypothetical protein
MYIVPVGHNWPCGHPILALPKGPLIVAYVAYVKTFRTEDTWTITPGMYFASLLRHTEKRHAQRREDGHVAS